MGDIRVPDLNQVIIAGRLTRDPELKYISSGRAVCTISIANTQYYKDKQGERKENTTFVEVTLWDKAAEYIGENLQKGRPVLIEGRLKSDSWEDKQTGQKRSKIAIAANRVTPLDWDSDGQGDRQGGGGGYRGEGYGGGSQRGGQSQHRSETRAQEYYDDGSPIPEDDIPF